MQPYPAVVSRCSKGFCLSFPDIPELLAFGKTLEAAVECARADLPKVVKQFYSSRSLPRVMFRGRTELNEGWVDLAPIPEAA